jgi:extradiol dioxygenase family protein
LPVLVNSGNEVEIRVFFDKTSMTRENLDNIMLNLEHFNVVLTCDQVYLNSSLRLELYRQDYELMEGVRYHSSHHGFIVDVFGALSALNNISK